MRGEVMFPVKVVFTTHEELGFCMHGGGLDGHVSWCKWKSLVFNIGVQRLQNFGSKLTVP
jgi:hypothetical protein